MSTNLSRLLLVPVWIAAIWGTLQMHQLDLQLGHSVCGPWGCGPRTEALLGYHGFWMLIFLPPAIGLGVYLSPSTARKVGLGVLMFGALAILVHVGIDGVMHANRVGSTEYVAQRAFFKLVTSVDLPMIPTILAGSLLAFVFGRKAKAADSVSKSEPQLETASPFASEP